MNIITAEQWAEWRLSPVTQEFLKYIKMKKEDIARQKIDMISGPAENINPYNTMHDQKRASLLFVFIFIFRSR